MNTQSGVCIGRSYRVDVQEGVALCAIDVNERIDFADLSPGTEFLTIGSTPSLREKFNITHAACLVLHFDERSVPYFSTAHEVHIEVLSCRDLRLTVVDVPHDGH